MLFLRILVVILVKCCMFSTKIWHYCTFKDSINKASVNVGDCFNLNRQYGLSVSEKNTDTKWWQNHSSFLNNTVRSQMVTWKSEISQLKFLLPFSDQICRKSWPDFVKYICIPPDTADVSTKKWPEACLTSIDMKPRPNAHQSQSTTLWYFIFLSVSLRIAN